MASTLRFDNWENTDGTQIATATGNAVNFVGNITGNVPWERDFASFGSSVAVTVANTTPVKVTFDTTLMASSNMSWAFGTANGSIPAYNWKHSQAGYYKLTHWLRTTNDMWNVISVCTGDNYTQAVGTSARTGSIAGAYGWSAELIYKVENVSDTFSLFHWSSSASSAMSAFSGTPPTGFIAPTQDGVSAPANGYFHTFNIVPLSSL